MAEKLTPQQLEAVTNRGGKLLVSAAAGSGKTKVLVDRLISYLTDPVDPANIDEFLIITFTKAAAAELRGKIASKLSERISQEPENRHLQQQLQRLYMTTISTVHSFCSDILHQFAYQVDLSADFRVADENECRQLQDAAMELVLEEAYQNASENPQFCAFVDTQGIGRNDKAIPQILLRVYQSAQCHLDPRGWIDGCLAAAESAQAEDASQTKWGKYLMDSFFSYLDLQLEAMERCAHLADQAVAMEKVATILWDTVHQLRHLRDSNTWDEVVQRRNIDYGTLRFSKKIEDEALKEGIKAVRDACKKGVAKYLKGFTDSSAQILTDLHSSAAAVHGMMQLVERFGVLYDEMKHRRRILDFGDLEHKTLDLLLGKRRSGPTAIAREIGRRFREVMVDEYQDSNEVQDAIYSALTEQNQNCFMVGDVKQSIYQFRLADPGIFLQKYHTYQPAAEATDGQGRKVILSSNFRSCGAVLSAVNSVFEICMSPQVGGLYYGEEEALHEGIPHMPLDEPEVELYGIDVQEATSPEEAEFTAQRIHELLDGNHFVRDGDQMRPITADDIVILLRAPKSVGEYFRLALERRGIRCAAGGGGDLLKTKEITVLRSLLQAVHNPKQDIPMVAALVSPLFCFTADDLAVLRQKHKSRSIYDALKACEGEKIQYFMELLTLLRREAQVKTLSELLETIYIKTNIDSIFSTMDGGAERVENLQSFYQLAVDFENGGHRDLGRFLEYLDSLASKGVLMGAEPSSAGCVTVMSIHKSKGLEFPVGFLGGLSRGFNKESARAQVLCDKELCIGTVTADVERRVRYPSISKRAILSKMAFDALSEELRILYVAMTRAKDRLIMTYTSQDLQGKLQEMIARINMGCDSLLIREADSLGIWVLLAALKRTEAGEFFTLAGCSSTAQVKEHPWLIRVVQADLMDDSPIRQEDRPGLTGALHQQMEEGLQFRYSYPNATKAPSKQTATQRKGRMKDQEAAENAQEQKPVYRTWRKPSFTQSDAAKTPPSAYGNAIHTTLQFIDYQKCGSVVDIETQVNDLVTAGRLTADQGALVDCGELASFFATPIGQQLRMAESVLREFKFSILDDGSSFGDGLEGEKILLQGVVDCAIVEPDGITVIDFKTDRISEADLDAAVQRYQYQVQAYAEALSRIYQRPIKRSCLFFFKINRCVDLS